MLWHSANTKRCESIVFSQDINVLRTIFFSGQLIMLIAFRGILCLLTENCGQDFAGAWLLLPPVLVLLGPVYIQIAKVYAFFIQLLC